MKKIIFIAALAIATLASCTKEEPINSSSEQEIAFNGVTRLNTKTVYGPVASTDYPEAEHFGVYAYYTPVKYDSSKVSGDSALYMNNVEVQKQTTYWANSTTKYYWPKSGKLTFACYSPKAYGNGVASSSFERGIAFQGFTTSTDITKQVDLLASDLIKDQTSEAAVSVQFRHLLSQIAFTVAPAQSDYNTNSNLSGIRINSIKVAPFKTVGDYHSTDGTYTNGSWSGMREQISYNLDILSSPKDVNLSSTSAVTVGTPIIVIPQTASNIIINYSIILKDANGGMITDTKEVIGTWTPALTTWVKGKKYTYNITIGLDQIMFAPSVVDWTDTTESTQL
ncbi:MAG: fimbrillin family protein [Bacteroidales bacterium]|jgi:hypothetical protein|nr:fimbrillin family protein [Bacteroidales bacterium]